MKRPITEPEFSLTPSGTRRAVAEYYAAAYREHGDTARGMDWRDSASQRLRFERLIRELPLAPGGSLIDVGCGNAELLAFLRARRADVRYRGLDVCPEMVAAARRRFGARNAWLGSTDDLERRGWRADYVVASGTFNVKQDVTNAVWERYLEHSVAQMFRACRVAAVFNVTSTRATRRYARLFYLEPARAAELADDVGAAGLTLDHHYPLFELTLTLWR